MRNATMNISLQYTGAFRTAQTREFLQVVPCSQSLDGTITVVSGTTAGSIFFISCGTINVTWLTVHNHTEQDIGIRFNTAASDQFHISAGATLTLGLPEELTSGNITSICFITTDVAASDGRIEYFILGTNTDIPAPTISSIDPAFGSSLGDMVPRVITGSNLIGATVTIGGSTATATIDSPTQITVTSTPALTADALYDVEVTTLGGISKLEDGYEALPLCVWLNDALSTFTSGEWADQSGHNRTLTATNGIPSVISADARFNAHSSVSIGASKMSSASWGTISQPIVWYYAAVVNPPGSYGVFIDGITNPRCAIFTELASGKYKLDIYAGSIADSGIKVYPNVAHVGAALFNGAAASAAVSDGEVSTGLSPGTGSTSGLTLGSQFDNTNNATATFAEVIGVVGTSIDQRVITYLANKYGANRSAQVTTFAGTSGVHGSTDATGLSAQFYYPSGLTSDGVRYLYVADSNNGSIRKVDVTTAAVTTLVADAWIPTNFPTNLVYARGALYICDYEYHSIRRVDVGTGAVTLVAGSGVLNEFGSVDDIGSAARFCSPFGLAYDGSKYLYVVDSQLYVGTTGHTIRRVDLDTNAVVTLAGLAGTSGSADGTGSAARFAHPTGCALDGVGYLWISDHDNETIRKLKLSDNSVTTVAGTLGVYGGTDGIGSNAKFHDAGAVICVNSANMLVINSSGHSIRRLHSVGSEVVVTTIAGVSDGGGGSTDGTGPAAAFSHPIGPAWCNGDLYIADNWNHTIRKLVWSP